MIVSGLLVAVQRGAADRVVAAMAGRPGLTPGRLQDRWLPVAAEARDDEAARELHDWLMGLPGVEYVDVTSVHFEDEADGEVCDRNGEEDAMQRG